VRRSALILGFTSIVAQVVLTRELLDLFLGNELSIALVLSAWLVAVALGGAAGTVLKASPQKAARMVLWVQLAAGILLPAAVLVARIISIGGIASGQAPGISGILAFSLLVLAPVCVLIGVQFVLLCRAAPGDAARQPGPGLVHVGRVYALEAVGAIAGGLAFHFYMAERLGALQNMMLLGSVNWLGAAGVLWSAGKRAAKLAAVLTVLWALMVGFIAASRAGQGCETAMLQFSPRWRNTTLRQELPSRYGNLVVAQHAGQVALYQSGVLLFTSEDQESNESLAHIALLQHPNPRQVLLIGGGAAGMVGEILKHGVSRLDYVELDPRIISLAEAWLPARLVGPLSDRRVHVHLGDGRLFVKGSRLRFDVVIVALPDPTTASLNRFYTRGFFSEVARAMNPGAVMLTAMTSSEAYMGGAMRLATASVYHSLRTVFADTLIVPGERLFLLASNRRGRLSRDWRLLAQRMRERCLHCHFVTPHWLEDAFLPFRRETALSSLRRQREVRSNDDLAPVAYRYQMALWLEQMSPGAARIFERIWGLSLWWFLPLILAALVWAAAAPRRWSRPAAAVVGMAAMGAFGLASEFIALLIFQAARGYLYHHLGILFSLFMGGLAAGAFWATKRGATAEGWEGRWLLISLAAAAAAATLSPAASACLRWETLATPLIAIFLVVAGFVDGSAFPAAVGLYASRGSSAPAGWQAGGLIYAADLAGSALGGLIAASMLIPVLGISGASFAVALLMLAAALLAIPLFRHPKRPESRLGS
jgi:spermidine synthase